MFTSFYKEEDAKSLYFDINSSFQICYKSNSSNSYKFAGLYSIHKGNICYYVGQSQNLASRISQHITGKYSNADEVRIYFCDCYFYKLPKTERKKFIESNELLLIKRLKPTENLITAPLDYELSNDLRFDCLKDIPNYGETEEFRDGLKPIKYDENTEISGSLRILDDSIWIGDADAIYNNPFLIKEVTNLLNSYDIETIKNGMEVLKNG